MISTILHLELKQRFTHWMTLILYAILIFQGIWYTKGTFDFYVNEDLLMNAPAVFYKNLAGGGILMIIIIAVITGPVLFKELQHKTGEWIFSYPINEKKLLVSKFLSAFTINVLIAFGYVIGMLLTPYSGIGEAHRFGPAPVGQLLHGFCTLVIPNMLLLTGIVFFALVYFKRMAAAYLGVLITIMIFLILQTTAESSGITPLLQLCEPFGYIATDYSISQMTVEERNFGYLSMSSLQLTNRIIWLSVSILLFLLTYYRFSFKWFLKPADNAKKVKIDFAESRSFGGPISTVQSVNTRFTQFDFVRKLRQLSVLEFKNVARPSGFRIILGIIVLMNVLQNLLWNASHYIGNTEPVTSTMTLFRLSFGVFIMILIMVWAGELFFKDRITKFWEVADAMPVPVWVVTLSRFIAMAGIAFLFAFTFMVTGIFAQIAKGGSDLIDFRLYLYDTLGYTWGWLTYILEIATVFFLAGLTKSRFATHILSIGILFATIMAFELNLAEQTIYAYAAVPGLEDYSEISGYGIWMVAAPWYFLMWSALATALVLAGVWLWQRGTSRNFSSSFSLRNNQLNWVGKTTLILCVIAFFVVRGFVISQVNAKGNFTASSTEEAENADYEKQFGYLKELKHPKYEQVNLDIDLFPDDRKAVFEANVRLSQGGIAADTLFLNFADFIEIKKFVVDGHPIVKAWENESLGLSAWPLPAPVSKDSTISLTIAGEKNYTGFTQSGASPQPDLMFNGSFAGVKDFLPTIGFDYEKMLLANRVRLDNGLNKLSSRLATPKDPVASQQDFFAPDANWTTGRIVVSTQSEQTAVATGHLVEQWAKGERNYYRFDIEHPAPFDWHLGSARYKTHTFEASNIEVRILFDPKHVFNIDLYEDAVRKVLAFVKDHLGALPYPSIQIVEIPYYQEAFYSSPQLIAISEKEGWYANTDAIQEQAYIYQSVGSQIIKQWLYQNLRIARVQGATMLVEALPEALALYIVKMALGEEASALIREIKNDNYYMDKNNEANREPSLLYADDTDYLEKNKGAIGLFNAIQTMGLKTFSATLQQFVEENQGSYVSFESFFIKLKPQLSNELVRVFEPTL